MELLTDKYGGSYLLVRSRPIFSLSQRFAQLRRVYEAGEYKGFVEGLELAKKCGMKPVWIKKAKKEILRGVSRRVNVSKVHIAGEEQLKIGAEEKHFQRYFMVEILANLGVASKYKFAEASNQLRNTQSYGSESVIEKSWLYVKKHLSDLEYIVHFYPGSINTRKKMKLPPSLDRTVRSFTDPVRKQLGESKKK